MTKTQRKKHIVSINNFLVASGYTLDRWNVYKNGKIRVNTKETNLKIFYDGEKLFSVPMVNLTLADVQKLIAVEIFRKLEARNKIYDRLGL